MSTPNLQRGGALAAFTNLTDAAAILEVSTSTISRRKDLRTESRGERDLVLAPQEVLRLGTVYRRRSLNDIAQDLIDHAERHSAESRRQVEAEIEEFFEQRTPAGQDREAFLATAQILLPGALYEQVEGALAESGDPLPDEVTGYPPPDDD